MCRLICGPRLAACGIVLSAWGVIMLGMLGIFFHTHSAVLIEDLPLEEKDFRPDPNPPQRIYEAYDAVGTNCLVAATVYLLIGVYSCCQMRLNRLKTYLVQ